LAYATYFARSPSKSFKVDPVEVQNGKTIITWKLMVADLQNNDGILCNKYPVQIGKFSSGQCTVVSFAA